MASAIHGPPRPSHGHHDKSTSPFRGCRPVSARFQTTTWASLKRHGTTLTIPATLVLRQGDYILVPSLGDWAFPDPPTESDWARSKRAMLGTLVDRVVWVKVETMELIQTQLGASRVFIWNSVTRSSDPALNAPYEGNHLQKAPIKGLQFGTTIRPTATGAHVDQDAPNSMRMCRLAAGDDVKYARVQQINVWRPLRGPVTKAPLTLCDGRTVDESCKGIHCGFFGSRVTVHHGPEQKWYYLSRMQPDEALLIKIYDSQVREGDAPYAPHSGCDIHGHDGPETPRESIEVRVVAVYDE